jgi:hypothetical protein
MSKNCQSCPKVFKSTISNRIQKKKKKKSWFLVVHWPNCLPRKKLAKKPQFGKVLISTAKKGLINESRP